MCKIFYVFLLCICEQHGRDGFRKFRFAVVRDEGKTSLQTHKHIFFLSLSLSRAHLQMEIFQRLIQKLALQLEVGCDWITLKYRSCK